MSHFADTTLVSTKRRLNVSLCILGLVIFAWRLVGLHWDAPAGLSWSTDLLSDEGFYCRNAIGFSQHGEFVQPGDFNSVLLWPVWPIIQGGVLKLTAPNLIAARALSSVVFALATLIAGYIARKAAGSLAQVITIGFLLCSHMLFGFSRLALLEVPVTLFGISAIGAHLSLTDRAIERRIAAMALLAMGLLTKTTALAFVPALVLLEFRANQGTYTRRAVLSLISAVGGLFIMASVQWVLGQMFPSDEFGAASVQLSDRVKISDQVHIARLLSPARSWDALRAHLGLMRFPMDVVFAASLVWACTLWKNAAVAAVLTTLFSHVAMLAVSDYQPTRYFIPMLTLHVILGGVALASLAQARSRLIPRAVARSVVGLLVAAVCVRECLATLEYMQKRETSIYDTAVLIRSMVCPEVGDRLDWVLTDVPTISLLTSVPYRTINTAMCTATLDRRAGNLDQRVLVLNDLDYPEVLALRSTFSFETLCVRRVLTGRPNERAIHVYRLSRQPPSRPALSGEGL